MRTLRVVAVLVALTITLSSCGFRLGNTPEEGKTKPAAKEEPVQSPTGSPIKVVSLVAGDRRDATSEEITNATTTFTTKTPTIYVNAGIAGLTKGAKITGTLRVVDVVTASGDEHRDTDLGSLDVIAPGDKATAHFSFTADAEGWPVGSYVLNVTVDGQQTDSIELTVKKAE